MSDLLLTRQRQGVIAERLAQDGRVVAAALAREFKVSDDTVRRDLREMAAAGLCERVYGGALPKAPSTGSLNERRTQDPGVKSELAAAAVRFVTEGMTLFIDAGSTNVAVASKLPAHDRLTIVTNSPAIAMAVPARRGTETILIGGRFDPEIGACVGGKALSAADGFRPDLLVLGACGVDAEAGVTAFSQEEAELKRRIALSARAVMVVSTAEKLGTAAPFAVLPAARLTRLVTDEEGDPAVLAAFETGGTSVLRVPVGR